MAREILLPGGVLAMTAAAADRLLKAGNGDAALLYLHLLRGGGAFSPEGSRQALGWADERVRQAWEALAGMALVEQAAPPQPNPTPPEPQGPPDYTAADIAKELEGGGSFPGLVEEVQRQLGKLLSTSDLKILYSLYDYLALPAEVILMLVTWCVEETERKYGPGRKPRMTQVRREGFIWHRLGVDTPEAADSHLRHLTALAGRERYLLPLLGISGRQPVEGERKYIAAWVEMGFDDDAIHLAYEKTVLKKGSLNWAYMNSILKSWHQKGLHTVEQVERGDSAWRRSQGQNQSQSPGPAPGPGDDRAQADMERLRRYLSHQDQKEGE